MTDTIEKNYHLKIQKSILFWRRIKEAYISILVQDSLPTDIFCPWPDCFDLIEPSEEPLAPTEINLINDIRQLGFGKITVHIKNGLPLEIVEAVQRARMKEGERWEKLTEPKV